MAWIASWPARSADLLACSRLSMLFSLRTSHREMNNLRFGHRSLHLLPLGRNHHAAAPFFISVFKGQSFLFLLKLLRATDFVC